MKNAHNICNIQHKYDEYRPIWFIMR